MFSFNSDAPHTAHEAGKCALHVTCNGVLISKAAMFEYRARGNQSVAGTHDWLSLDGESVVQ